MNKRTFQRNLHKAGFLPVLLLCLVLCFGCDKEKNATVTPTESGEVTASVTGGELQSPTATPTSTVSPTPKADVAKLGYETYLRKDLYKIPVGETKDGRTVKDARFAGEYALLRYVPQSEESQNGEAGDTAGADNAADNTFVLICPAVNADQNRLAPEFKVRAFDVLADGTVFLEESGSGTVHVFDSTMTELRSIPSAGKRTKVVGFAEDGTIWSVDIAQAKLMATDIKGESLGDYPYTKGLLITDYIGRKGDRECFRTATGSDDDAVISYLYISVADGETVIRDVADEDLGYAWTREEEIYLVGDRHFHYSDALWVLHDPGYGTQGVAFLMSAPMEKAVLIDGDRFCGSFCAWDGDTVTAQTYRLYNLESREVSGTLPDAELGEYESFELKGFVGDGLLFNMRYKDGSEELLLWAPDADWEPILGFFDLSKDDPVPVLDEEIKMLQEQYGIVITPDRAADGGALPLGDMLAQMETAARFLVAARTGNEAVKSSTGTIHPENYRTNDVAHYTFNPHVISPFLEKEREGAKETFFAFVDALRAGEDSFACPDADTMEWCGDMLAHYCFLIAEDYAYGEYVGDGRAKIVYRVTKEEYLQKEREYEELIESILNDVLEDDYTDLEKALAIYEYMAEYCIYDMDKLFTMMNGSSYGITQTGYSVLLGRKGVCWEIASLYAYLLMQSGVGADVVIGDSTDPEVKDLHAWVYIELDGKGYLIDPTWGINSFRSPDIAYFLMTDEIRETRDLYSTATAQIAGLGPNESREKYSFYATDDHFSPIWEGLFVAFDEETDSIYFVDYYGVLQRFDYGK